MNTIKIDEKEVLREMGKLGFTIDKRIKKNKNWLKICDNIIWKKYFFAMVNWNDENFCDYETQCFRLAQKCAGKY